MFLIIFREFCHIATDLLSMFPNGLVSTPLYSDTYISQCYWVKEILPKDRKDDIGFCVEYKDILLCLSEYRRV